MNLAIGKIILIILLSLFLGVIIVKYFNNTYIKAEFDKLDPMPPKMFVYYNGFKIGNSSKVKISKDFKTTYLYITLNGRGLQLPKNISVEIKNYDEDIKYVDIIYPRSPMIKYIKTGDVIKGQSTFSFSGISNLNQTHIDNLSEKGENLLTSARGATDSLMGLFDLITEILEENRENLYLSSTNLKNSTANIEVTTKNIKELSEKINKEISKEIIKNSALNIEKTTSNFANSSNDFITISKNFNKTSYDINSLTPKLSILIDATQMTICNINDIIMGVKRTLMKRFGGTRLLFGKPIS